MKRIAKLIYIIIVISGTAADSSGEMNTRSLKIMDSKIRIIFEDTVLTATMYDNPTARDFVAALPLTLKLEDYAGTEKISQLPKKLSLQNAPSGSDPLVGDITYYSPWGNLAIFYRDFGYASGLILLGKIDANVQYLEKWKNSRRVRIEVAKPD